MARRLLPPAILVLAALLPLRGWASDATALRLANGSGASGYVRVAHHADFEMQSFTVEAWVQRFGAGLGFTTDPTGSGIVSMPRENVCGSNIASWHMDYSNTGQIMFNVVHTYSTSGLYLQSPALPDPLVRHHIAVSFDGSNARIFVDGTLRASAAWSLGTVYYGAEQLLIGANNWACGYLRGFDGTIDDVRVWNYARTAAQIAAYKDCRLTGTEAGLMGYWTFDGSDLTDQTGRGHVGSTTGTVSYQLATSLGTCTVGVADGDAPLGNGLVLSLHPVPARDGVNLEFELPRAGHVTVDVLDVAGRRLALWEQGEYPAGRHRLTREVASLASGGRAGLRFVRLRSESGSITRTLVTLD